MLSERSSGRGGSGLPLLFLGLAVFVVYAGTTMTEVTLPALRDELPASPTQLRWVASVYVLASACLLLSGGALGDILGRKRVFLAGLAGFGATSAWCAAAPSIGTLLVARAAQGAFGSVLIPVSLALVAALFPDPAARARAIGLGAGFCGLALGMGPVLGGLVVDGWGWRAVFWLNVPVAAVALLGLRRSLPDGEPRRARRLDVTGQLLFVVAAAALVFALAEGNAQGWTSAPVAVAFALAAVALPGFLWREVRATEPMLPLGLFRSPVVVSACTVNLLSLFGLYAAMSLVAQRMHELGGLTASQIGVRFLVLNGAIAVASCAVAFLVVGTGPRLPVVLGTLCSGVALLGLARLGPAEGHGSYGWLLALLGTGVSLAAAPATVALLGAVPVTWAGTASGVSNTFRQLGSVLGVAASGATVSAQGLVPGAASALSLAAVLVLSAGLLALVLLRRRGGPEGAEPRRGRTVASGPWRGKTVASGPWRGKTVASGPWRGKTVASGRRPGGPEIAGPRRGEPGAAGPRTAERVAGEGSGV
ncbi:MFS transporter [Streptomyces sp. NPDC058052]|uniref:MFS transporter n=1 Tax=Streptomyces sp. NPDC058052 TaxID=3346316 RepID=UPI0036E91130